MPNVDLRQVVEVLRDKATEIDRKADEVGAVGYIDVIALRDLLSAALDDASTFMPDAEGQTRRARQVTVGGGRYALVTIGVGWESKEKLDAQR